MLIVLGALSLVYGAAVYFWRDPVTDLYARWKQSQLSDQLDERFAEVRAELGLLPEATEPSTTAPPADGGEESPAPAPPETMPAETPASAEGLDAATRTTARAVYEKLEPGEALGRLVIPKLDIRPVFVNGTRWGADLSRGPGRYPETFLPGMGRVTAIAGHRTTFGAPFRRIDDLEAGDPIRLELAYGTFHYEVVGHEIVDDEDWSIIKPRGYDALVLSACHPLYAASQRWIVYARLVSVDLPDGQSYRVPERAETDGSAA